jgi:hypothetical protein
LLLSLTHLLISLLPSLGAHSSLVLLQGASFSQLPAHSPWFTVTALFPYTQTNFLFYSLTLLFPYSLLPCSTVPLPHCHSFLEFLSFSLSFLSYGVLLPSYHFLQLGFPSSFNSFPPCCGLLSPCHYFHMGWPSSSLSFLPCGVSFFLVGNPSLWGVLFLSWHSFHSGVSFFLVGIPSMWSGLLPPCHSFHVGCPFS